jgi:hypothetical protein
MRRREEEIAGIKVLISFIEGFAAARQKIKINLPFSSV